MYQPGPQDPDDFQEEVEIPKQQTYTQYALKGFTTLVRELKLT